MAAIRVVIADDHSLFRDGLRRLLGEEPTLEVVGEAASGAEAFRLATEVAPDVLLLDMSMPDMTGLDVLRALAASHSLVRTVVLTAAIDGPDVVEAIRLGARGLVVKTSATQLLVKCLHSVMAGEYWFGHDRLPDLIAALKQVDADTPAAFARLTPRELKIVSAVVNGDSNREIARQYGLAEQTVKNHIYNIFEKLGVSNRLELALFVTHHKLLDKS